MLTTQTSFQSLHLCLCLHWFHNNTQSSYFIHIFSSVIPIWEAPYLPQSHCHYARVGLILPPKSTLSEGLAQGAVASLWPLTPRLSRSGEAWVPLYTLYRLVAGKDLVLLSENRKYIYIIRLTKYSHTIWKIRNRLFMNKLITVIMKRPSP